MVSPDLASPDLASTDLASPDLARALRGRLHSEGGGGGGDEGPRKGLRRPNRGKKEARGWGAAFGSDQLPVGPLAKDGGGTVGGGRRWGDRAWPSVT